jgi:type IV secretory pathway TrbF-like protein
MTEARELVIGRLDSSEPAGRRRFLEIYAEPLVLNSYLKTAVLALTLVSLGLGYAVVRTNVALRETKPVIVRINDVGKAEAVNYSSFAYQPQETDNRYFLSQWAQLFYARNRYTVQKDFTKALLFLNGDLQIAVIEENKKSKSIETFLVDPGAPNTDVEVKNVAIEDLRSAPYRARIEFYRVYTSPVDHSELKRELWTANVVYVFRDHVPNEMLLVNPLGLTITYFREDQAFEK